MVARGGVGVLVRGGGCRVCVARCGVPLIVRAISVRRLLRLCPLLGRGGGGYRGQGKLRR